ncbi:hypothetical protein GGR26_003348 [Lewinella marina]|uniref:HYR domain-containing protein n=1 Tax=Neolewinella marina TaxID=438751 RepID=A0A2G0CCP1_9BACT|nr:T9SS type A sorting domain-containing protein [Neolewinella marina]NJB87564.1 hypothetical protein [Neolewinella marina]PHK97744.1 hypothetical protein CGL56_15070 [Neolewinella marina]
MPLLILLLSIGWSVHAGAQEITFSSDCYTGTFTLAASVNGRNQFVDDDGDPNTNPSLRIAYNPSAARWEVQDVNDPSSVFYATEENSFFPNPPDSESATWSGMSGCTGTATLTGTGTQSTAGEGDACAGEGGDDDNDGICNDNDQCPGFDDNLDPDGDGIASGCDPSPAVFDGVSVASACFGSSSPLNFVRTGMDTTGRYVYTDGPRNLEIAFNPASGEWELRDRDSVSAQVYYSNPLPSTPNPPATVLQEWTTGICSDPATVSGSRSQTVVPEITCPTATVELFVEEDCLTSFPDLITTVTTNLENATITQSTPAGTAVSPSVGMQVTLVAEDSGGNRATCSVTVVVRDTLAPVLACRRDTIYLNAEGVAEFAIGDLATVTADNCPPDEVIPNPTRFYTREDTGLITSVEVRTDTAGNSASCTVELVVLDTTSTTANRYWRTPDDPLLQVFPNPNPGRFMVLHPAATVLQIHDATGRRVWSVPGPTGPGPERQTEVSVSLPPGIYLLTALGAERGWHKWFTINHRP